MLSDDTRDNIMTVGVISDELTQPWGRTSRGIPLGNGENAKTLSDESADRSRQNLSVLIILRLLLRVWFSPFVGGNRLEKSSQAVCGVFSCVFPVQGSPGANTCAHCIYHRPPR